MDNSAISFNQPRSFHIRQMMMVVVNTLKKIIIERKFSQLEPVAIGENVFIVYNQDLFLDG